MKTGRYLIAFLCGLILIASLGPAASGNDVITLDGLVVGVAEGDRITVNSYGNEIRVKLYGVAAPQIARIDNFSGLYKPGQPYGDDAFRALSSKVLHQQVKVEIRRTLIAKKDDPKQIALAVVYMDGRNINMEMIAEGWGWVYKKFMSRADAAHYTALERLARAHKHGLWFQDNPQPPWCFKPQLMVRTRR